MEEVKGSEDHDPSDVVVYTGFITKRGFLRKNWKRRYFTLTKDGVLSYARANPEMKVNPINLKDCTVVLPGGSCKCRWPSSTDPYCCFAIMTKSHKLFCVAETRADTAAWLNYVSEFAPEGVNVTTPQEIIQSWSGKLSDKQRRELDVLDAEDSDVVRRVSVFRNGHSKGGKVLLLPSSIDVLMAECSSIFDFTCGRIFDDAGQLIDAVRDIETDAILVAGKLSEAYDHSTLSPILSRTRLSKVFDDDSSGDEDVDLAALNLQPPMVDENGNPLPSETADDSVPKLTSAPGYMLPPGEDAQAGEEYFDPSAASKAAGPDGEYFDPSSTAKDAGPDGDYFDPSAISKTAGPDGDYFDPSAISKTAGPDGEYFDPTNVSSSSSSGEEEGW